MLRREANPASRFQAAHLAWEEGEEDLARLQVFEDHSRQILSHNDSPDLRHRWSLNPYRGCMHACAYCYARSSHEYLGFGAGTDHDVKILVKPRAPELLAEAFDHPSWVGEAVLFSGNTDCYQPLEHRWRLTRRCLEVCLRYRNPAWLITKSALVARDVDVLAALHAEAQAHVVLSIPFADAETARKIEPGAPSPERRFQALEALARAGVPVGINIAPVFPGLNDRDIPRLLRRAADAGARSAGYILVRLVGSVEAVCVERLREAFPARAEVLLRRIRRARGGELGSTRFGERMRGQGEEWEVVHDLFHLWCNRLGLNTGFGEDTPPPTTFRRPGSGVQLGLFPGR